VDDHRRRAVDPQTLATIGLIGQQIAGVISRADLRERLESLAGDATDLVLRLDRSPDLVITLGYPAGEMIGRQTPMAIHDEDEVRTRADELGVDVGIDVFVAAGRRGLAETREWTYVARDGGASRSCSPSPRCGTAPDSSASPRISPSAPRPGRTDRPSRADAADRDRDRTVSSSSMELTRRERERQAEAHGRQAIELRLRGRAVDAKRHADTGIELLDGLLARWPGDHQIRHVLAGQLYNRAAIFEQLGQPSAGIADARRSSQLYRDLADALPAATNQGADAQLRLARLMAQDTAAAFTRDVPYDIDARTATATADDVLRTGSAALDTYERRTRAGQASPSDLARARWSWAEVLRLLGTVAPEEVLYAYTLALETSYEIEGELTPEDRQYRAQALSAAVRLQRTLDEEIIELRSAANAAVEEWWTLTADGHNTHAPCLAAVYDLAMLARENDAEDWREVLLMGRSVLDAMSRPLDPESAAIAADIATLLHNA
jgi:hypothetical protein